MFNRQAKSGDIFESCESYELQDHIEEEIVVIHFGSWVRNYIEDGGNYLWEYFIEILRVKWFELFLR